MHKRTNLIKRFFLQKCILNGVWSWKFSGSIKSIIIFSHIFNMDGKSSTQNTQSKHFFCTFIRQLSKQNAKDCEFENFSSQNCCKFVVECDWNSEIFQIGTKVGNFLKALGFFKKLTFFQNRERWQIYCTMRIKWWSFLKISFHFNCEVFCKKLEDFQIWEN